MAEPSLTIELKNQLSELVKLRESLEQFAHDHGLPRAFLDDMNLALEEIVTNVVSYAFVDDDEHSIVVRLTLQEGILMAAVEDDGRLTNPLEAPAPDTEAPLDKRRIGGLGIHLVRRVMDEVAYRQENNKNIFVIKKRLPRS